MSGVAKVRGTIQAPDGRVVDFAAVRYDPSTTNLTCMLGEVPFTIALGSLDLFADVKFFDGENGQELAVADVIDVFTKG